LVFSRMNFAKYVSAKLNSTLLFIKYINHLKWFLIFRLQKQWNVE
jgi:hypothetical protein